MCLELFLQIVNILTHNLDRGFQKEEIYTYQKTILNTIVGLF